MCVLPLCVSHLCMNLGDLFLVDVGLLVDSALVAELTIEGQRLWIYRIYTHTHTHVILLQLQTEVAWAFNMSFHHPLHLPDLFHRVNHFCESDATRLLDPEDKVLSGTNVHHEP